jgi:hypothetical protein
MDVVKSNNWDKDYGLYMGLSYNTSPSSQIALQPLPC